MLAAPFHDELGKTRGSDGVGHDGEARLLIQQNSGNQGDQAVAVDFPARAVHDGGPVAVRIEDDAQVGSRFHHGGADGLHGLLVFGVGDMVGEHAVRFQELAALHPGAQVLQEPCVEAARAVARVHHHMQAQQGLLHVGIQALADAVLELLAVHGQEIPLHDGGTAAVQGRVAFGNVQDGVQIGAFDAALFGEKFQAVAVIGVMAGGNHHGTVAAEALGDQAHVHGRGGAHAVGFHLGSRHHAALGAGVQQRFAGHAGIPAQGYPGVIHAPILEPLHKRPADPGGHSTRQRRAVSQRPSAHIRSAFQPAQTSTHTFPPCSSIWFIASSTQPLKIQYRGLSAV